MDIIIMDSIDNINTTNITNITTTDSTLPNNNNQQEMSITAMIATGISCGILVCICFTICSERWDFYMTRKILGRRGRGGRRGRQSNSNYLHNDERSSDLSDLVNDWESGSDDSSGDGGNIRVSVCVF